MHYCSWIKEGDKVWAWDEETGEKGLKVVVETYVNETDDSIRVAIWFIQFMQLYIQRILVLTKKMHPIWMHPLFLLSQMFFYNTLLPNERSKPKCRSTISTVF